jgi:hypothetical protein
MSDTERLLARAKLAETLEGMIEGRLSFIEGSRIAAGLASRAGYEQSSEPFVTFVAIESETDAIPLGEVRELWHPHAIAKHAREWQQAETWAKQVGEAACRDALVLLRAD